MTAFAADLRARIEAAIGARIASVAPVSGGSICRAFRADTTAGPLFVKTRPHPPQGFFAAEADGLARLGQAGSRAPRVVSVGDDHLALAWLEPARPRWEDAGRALAALHAHRGRAFGLEVSNFMGAVPQDNGPASGPTFATFFRERRLEPLAHRLPARLRARLERLDLAAILTEPDAPRLVHGDLWSGNLYHAADGPTLIDPAIHYGHPEQDLAMTALFGGFPATFYAAYREAAGLTSRADADQARRLAVLNLYPLLIHLHLFGDGYLPEIEATLAG